MTDREHPFARLPDRITLTLEEAATLLDALDVAELTARSSEHRDAARRAIRIITMKLWPELGGLLEDNEE